MFTFAELAQLHRAAAHGLDNRVVDVRADQLVRPTPCAGWSVADLLAHHQGQNHGFALAVEHGDAPTEAFDPQPWDPARWQTASTRLQAAFVDVQDPEASVALRVDGADRPIPAQVILTMHLIDTVIHHWDLAAALGIDFSPAEGAVEATWEMLSGIPDGPPRGQPGAPFGPLINAEGASRWHQALAFSGRDPSWQAPAQTD
ncbi:MAG: TIGR03086 family metal-binding protein [Propionibacteriaceae bacterium]